MEETICTDRRIYDYKSDEDAGQKVPSHRDSSAKPVQSCEAYFGTVEFPQKGLNHSSRLRPIRIREVYFNTVAPYCRCK
ncbi:hypothetical protein HZH68_000070 [Vespula germanica]|uniref:Uncharacterized protein n=2 Tax=Vespula TaxID=7451 RepID=A0A834NT18_VESGE|nr:hypothetical protein HZH68_000070 [Vespula germanica]